MGLAVDSLGVSRPSGDKVLVVGGGDSDLKAMAPALAAWLQGGGKLLAIGLDESSARGFLPFPVRTERKEHIAAYFDSFGSGSPMAGIGPADVHDRDPHSRSLVSSGITVIGDGILGLSPDSSAVFLQLAPWEYDRNGTQNVKRTFRRTSYMLSRLLANLGVVGATPIIDRFASPVTADSHERRWESGLYLDLPNEWDDPYRFFRW
jgi:hypothetical protein